MTANTPKSRKAKGRLFQQQIAETIGQLLDIKPEKDGDIESRPMGQSGIDIILRGKALKDFPFSVETKRTEKVSLYNWIQQTKANIKDKTDWLLFHKKNHTDSIVILDTDVFFNLYRELLQLRNKVNYLNEDNEVLREDVMELTQEKLDV